MSIPLISLPPKLPPLDLNLGLDLHSRREFYRFRSTGRIVQENEEDGYYFHQKLVQQFMCYHDHLMLIHEAGSGKTKTALSVLKAIQKAGFLEYIYKKVVIATPNEELARAWITNSELTESDRRLYEVVTHYELSQKSPKDYPQTIFIVDEVHKLANESLMDANVEAFDRNVDRKDLKSKYGGVWNLLHRSKLSKVMLLTATPFQNDMADFYPLLNLILPQSQQILERRITMERLAERMVGRVSFVRNVYQDIRVEYDISDEMYDRLQDFQLSGDLGLHGNTSICTIEYVPLGKTQSYRVPFFNRQEFQGMLFSLFVDGYGSVVFNIERSEPRSVRLSRHHKRHPDGPTMELTLSNVEFGEYGDTSGSYMKFDLEWMNPVPGMVEALAVEDQLYLTLVVPGLLRSSIPLTSSPPGRFGVLRSILGAAHTGYLRDVERTHSISSDGQVEFDDRNPGKRLIFSDEQQSFVFRNPPIEEMAKDINQLSSYSKLYYHLILFIMSSATQENRQFLSRANPNWGGFLEGDPIEPGKSIFYTRYINHEYGLQFLEKLLVALGYEKLSADSNMTQSRPRFALSPDSAGLRDVINHADNWDGSRCQLVVFSQRGATGFSYFDIRHIHIVPGWSPSENTQAIFRGIRSGGHRNFVQRAGYNPTIRVYMHTITPHLGQSVTTPRFYEKEVIVGNGTFTDKGEDTNRFGWSRNDESGVFQRVYDGPSLDPMEFDSKISQFGYIEETSSPLTKVYFTILGLAMRNFSTVIMKKENMESPYRQIVNYSDMYSGLNSVLAYILSDSLRKDMEFAQVRRLLKSHSVDCDLLKPRNTLPEGFNNTSECDYGSCTVNCLSDSGMVQIRGNDVVVDGDGSDPRRTRALAPLSHHRTTSHDHYLTLTESTRRKLKHFIGDYMQRELRVNYYQLVKDVWGGLGSMDMVSEKHIDDVLLEMVYGKEQSILRDQFDRLCRLSYMGELLYLVPLEIGPEFIHERYREGQYSGKYLQNQYLSIHQTGIGNEEVYFKEPSITLASTERLLEGMGNRELVELMRTNFHQFVQFIESCYVAVNVHSANDPRMVGPAQQFGMYFAKIPRDMMQECYRSGRDSKVDSRVHFMEERRETTRPNQEDPNRPNQEQVLVNFLWHIYPSTVTPRGFISDFSYIRFLDQDTAFHWANDGQRKSVVQYIKERSKLTEQTYLNRSPGLFGYVDYRNKLLDPQKPEEYLMLVFKDEPTQKALQGRACKSFTTKDYDRMSEKLNVTLDGSKEAKCRVLERVLGERNLIVDSL